MLKITHENKSGIFINSGIGRSAYICKTKKCAKDPKLKKIPDLLSRVIFNI